MFQPLSRREYFWRGVGLLTAPSTSLVLNALDTPLWLSLPIFAVSAILAFFVLRRFTTMESTATGPVKPEKWRFGFPDRSTLRPGKYRSGRTGDGI
ncbi:hypothetical protein IL38_22180 [Actinopolyspora erythraea]|uniref:Uncharacterized protein n=1 Tax=Actinopolyspora erythraea TaxID=414996 RepID=A0ABR4WZ93_9ACTN|nr:hypothetical protein IL38_22180 [Actinopolyspora erythraea]